MTKFSSEEMQKDGTTSPAYASNFQIDLSYSRGSQFHITNLFVSNKHVRVYTILFDQDNLGGIPPLVYAQDLSMNGTFWNDYRMGKDKGSFLLTDGDLLRVAVGIHVQFKSAGPDNENKFTQLQQLEMKKFQKSYVITQSMLGSGAYGRVHMAFNQNTGRQFACKIVDLQAVRADLQAQAREAQAGLGEQHHCKFFAKQPEPRNYMFTELVTCGDLFSFVRNRGTNLEDTTVALIMRQILLALEYLHDRNIVHRDVKPDNILMTSLEPGGRVVLADFGCARLVNQPVQRMSSIVGTPEYCAPELLQTDLKGYTKAVDMWSLGCVAAVLLVGDTPFDNTYRSTSSDLINLDHDMRALEIDPRARDFVFRSLVLDETKRMDVKQALRHDWFTNPAQAGWFKEMYSRSIQNWKPRNASEAVTVELTSFKSVQTKWPRSESVSSWSPKEGARFADVDHISESSWENVAPASMKPLISPAISIPAPAKRTSCRPPLVPLGPNPNKPKHPQEIISPDADVKFVSQVKCEQLDRSKLERHVLYVSPCEGPNVQRAESKKAPASKGGKQTTKAKFTINKDTGLKNFFLSSHSAAFPPIPSMRTNFPKMSPKDEGDESDQVYEEVRNPVTGKRKRLIYGRDMESLSQML
ncbi:Meiosis-specific serine/threonine-protein kinase mek1 [Penicillium subrubescens]|uniref:Meiosis-specific serine/threonine-protein kinase mek1 n=1 Tax=Penicillium subrubescens TaxID=1316194 RepID=A0A1Q5TL19_9EURO|nr:Meiosis-specific serine/threonine-protein kinase mek1 [Penicillium subrubescens]